MILVISIKRPSLEDTAAGKEVMYSQDFKAIRLKVHFNKVFCSELFSRGS